MKPFDTIYRVEKKKADLPNLPAKNPDNLWRNFYKSLQIVLTFWIVTVLTITTFPWINYAIKAKIDPATQPPVTNVQSDATISAVNGESDTPTFSLSNGKVNIQAPIVEGIDETSLKQGIGHQPGSVWPNQKGNVVIAGHSSDLDASNPFREVFISLRLVDIGDEVTINYQGKIYHYQVFKKETVSSTDTSLFAQTDDWLLTFYTCDPPYTDWKRLVLQAKLEKIE